MPIMTAVFDVPDDVWEKNPFDIETPFGKAVTIAKGDLTEKLDRLSDLGNELANAAGDIHPTAPSSASITRLHRAIDAWGAVESATV